MIDSQIKRSVYAGTGTLEIGEKAKIGKDLYYAASDNEANISPSAKIAGSIYKTETINPQDDARASARKNIPGVMNGFKFGSELISFLGALIIGYIYFKLFGKHFEKTADLISSSFWKTFGIGFLVSIAFIPALIIMLITIIGIPVAGVAIPTFMIVSYLAKLIVGLALGKWISQKFNWKMSTFAVFALGLLVIYVLKMIPVVGIFTGFAVVWIGRGAFALNLTSKND
jgi:hypothetical protein